MRSIFTDVPKLSRFILILTLILLLTYSTFLQFLIPTLYEVDGYYHLGVASFISEYGLKYSFRWAEFSTFKNSFSDKDLFLHILIIPFTFLFKDIIIAGKVAVVFINLSFLLILTFVLRKYLEDFLIPVFLMSIFLSHSFLVYSLYLRSGTMANMFTVLIIYFLIEKRLLPIFLISLLYTLSHISFIMVLIFALLCESIRFFYKKELFVKNIIIVLFGMVVGVLIHPNFPNNLFSFYQENIMVFFHSLAGRDIGFGGELLQVLTKEALFNNFIIFFMFILVFWSSLISKVKVSFPTIVFFAVSNVYLVLSFFSNKFWYYATPLVIIFTASYFNDWMSAKKIKIRFLLYGFLLISMFLVVYNNFSIKNNIKRSLVRNKHYENVARWMGKNIPKEETIYHSCWSDSPYFICLNPKNNYIVVLNTIYMYEYAPDIYETYIMLGNGENIDAYHHLKNTFKTRYGYTRKDIGFYNNIRNDNRFKIIYDDGIGIVFSI